MGNSNNEFDGRDALVKKHMGSGTLVANVQSVDAQVAQYKEPWQRPYYNQFDDFLPANTATQWSCVEGVHGRNTWTIPVTNIEHVTGGYEQVHMGTVVVSSIPDYETGVSEWFISIVE